MAKGQKPVKPFVKGHPGGPGRKPDNSEEKKVKEIMKRLKGRIDPAIISEKLLAENELRYHFNRYGLVPISESMKENSSNQTCGFAKVILAMYGKAFGGDIKALEMILKIGGVHYDRVDHTSSDGSAKPTFTLNYNLDDDDNEA